MAALLSVRSVWVNRRGEEALLDEEKARHAPLTVTFKVCLPGEQHAESQAHAPSPRQLHCCMPYLGDGPGGYATVCIAACWHLMTRIHSCQAAGKCRAQGYTTSCRHHSCEQPKWTQVRGGGGGSADLPECVGGLAGSRHQGPALGGLAPHQPQSPPAGRRHPCAAVSPPQVPLSQEHNQGVAMPDAAGTTSSEHASTPPVPHCHGVRRRVQRSPAPAKVSAAACGIQLGSGCL